LDEVITILRPALHLGGYEVEYRKTKMETPALAQQYHFESSPTIRVNGREICFNVQESDCGCCSDISGTDVDCRIFEYKGQSYEVPPKEMLAEAILKAVFGTVRRPLRRSALTIFLKIWKSSTKEKTRKPVVAAQVAVAEINISKRRPSRYFRILGCKKKEVHTVTFTRFVGTYLASWIWHRSSGRFIF
jgi:hypothetical protein